MDHIAEEIIFKGKKPSFNQVLNKAYERVKQGHTLIEIYWGENGITLDKDGNTWYGFGWIKDISGYDLSDALNARIEKQLLNLYNT